MAERASVAEESIVDAAAQPITVVVTRKVRPGCEAKYEAWLHGVVAAARAFPGHLGVHVLRPPAAGRDYTLMFRFDRLANLQAWEHSAERASWLARVEELCEPGLHVQQLTGMEGWFQLPGHGPLPPPPRWKMALLTWMVAFPTIQVLSATLAPALSFAPSLVRGAALGAAMVVLMTWVLMPRVTAFAARWLYRI